MTKTIDWTEAKIQQLKQLFDEGYSGAVMAEQLAVTRNAAMSKCVRMGWTRPATPGSIMENRHKVRRARRKSYKPRPSLKDSRQENYGGRAGKIQRDAANREAREAAFEDRITEHDAAIPLEQRKTFWELDEYRHCRYPVGTPGAFHDSNNGFFCGARKSAGSSYCAHHHAVVWVRPRRA